MTVQSDSDPLSPGVAPAALLRAARDVHVVQLGPNRASFPLAGPDTAGAYSLSDFTMAAPPAPSPPPHVHEDADECVYVLEGTLEMGVGEDRLTGGPGSLMRAPRGTPHSLVNAGPGPARFIVVLSPPGFEGFWREMADLRARIGGPPDPEIAVGCSTRTT